MECPSGLPEFFATSLKPERLPGHCLRFVFVHPVEGDVFAVIVPYGCWLEMRLDLARFALECARGTITETVGLAH